MIRLVCLERCDRSAAPAVLESVRARICRNPGGHPVTGSDPPVLPRR